MFLCNAVSAGLGKPLAMAHIASPAFVCAIITFTYFPLVMIWMINVVIMECIFVFEPFFPR